MSAIGAQAIFDSIAKNDEEEISLDDFMARLSDFGHSDQDILRLFEFMDADNSNTIDRCEFINGYKQYARATGSTLGQEWRLWNQLDQRDEEDRLKMAKLFMILDMMEEQGSAGEDVVQVVEEKISRSRRSSFNYSGVVITTPMALNTADLLRQGFTEGTPLGREYAAMVVTTATDIFAAEQNVMYLAAPTEQSSLTIVGDLHGSLADLNCILNEIGEPSPSNRVLFNGDFVDRGTHGIEVLLVLLVYKCLHPESVHLNRGNHEDALVNQSYGFQQECVQKYDKTMFKMIVQLFKNLPLCAVVGGGPANSDRGLFVVHGGLFSDPDATLDSISAIERKKYSTVMLQTKRPSEEDVLIEEMLWSDPTADGSLGLFRSDRGCGIEFGPDVTVGWLKSIGCHSLVRSHECIEDGCEFVPINLPPNKKRYSIYTVFSASNYSDGDNQGAVLKYVDLTTRPKVFRFRSSVKPPDHRLISRNRMRLADMLFRRHYRLVKAFAIADPEGTGQLAPEIVCGVLKATLGLDITWIALLPSLVGALDYKDGSIVDYNKLLERFSSRGNAPQKEQALLSQMYDNFDLLKNTFEYWDTDHSGGISKEEFSVGVAKLNELTEDESMHLNAQDLFDLVDADHNGEIDIDEFCEAFRQGRTALCEDIGDAGAETMTSF